MIQIKDWVSFEDAIEQQLQRLQEVSRTAYLRLFDTKSAGALIPPQPSDFLVTHNGITTLIEAKFSSVNDSLRQCFSSAVSSNQTASAKIWTRALAQYKFLFYPMQAGGKVEVWDGRHCYERRAEGKPLNLSSRVVASDLTEALMHALQKDPR